MSLRSRIVAFLLNQAEYETGGPEIAIEEATERRAQIIEDAKLPTFRDVAGCDDCGVIQVQPADGRCMLCGSESIANLVLQLQRGVKRIDKRRPTPQFTSRDLLEKRKAGQHRSHQRTE